MIDIENAKKEFMNYVKKYDINNGRIHLKVKHILRVAEVSKIIATKLNLTENQIRLAELIGLFHDIGRFEQVRLYDTFSDKDSGLDHASYSLKVLYEDGLIKKFLDTDEYDDIIKKAVYNHNKIQIDSDVTEDALLFSKIIRDADKTDIYRVLNEDPMIDIFWYKEFENLKINDKAIDMFKQEKLLKYKDIKNNADLILVFYGYIFDFNFPYGLEIIRENKCLEDFAVRISNTFKSKKIDEDVQQIIKICNEYIDKKIKNT